MKPQSAPKITVYLIALITCSLSHAQNISISASGVWMTAFSKDTVFNVTGSLGSAGNVFTGNNFGVHIPNSHSLVFRGGQLTSHSTSLASDVCTARMYYRVYPQGGTPGTFSEIDFFFGEDCEFPPQFNSGGGCSVGDQKFDFYLPDGTTDPYAPLDLTTLPIGNYTIEVYYAIDGLTDCGQTVTLNNGGNNYKASFSIQNPTVSGTDPLSCNGADGLITIGGLVPAATYSVRYTDDGNPIGPINIATNAAGQLVIGGLNAGAYSSFRLVSGGISTDLTNTVNLSSPGVTPKFKKIDPLCSGSTPPVLPTTSQNGITGTWNPAVIDNQTSRSYVFTPGAGQCASTVTIDITVMPTITPSFNFGSTLNLCPGSTTPTLYKPSDNGVTGTWTPTVIDNQNSGTYTFTPNPNQCANVAALAVTINPSVTPTFSFGTSLSICAGTSVPALPTTSLNGITGTWLPSTIDNQNSGSYTFTPATGQCSMTTVSFTVTVKPVITPVFSFGTSLSICSGSLVPSLPTTSSNGISGTWSPATVNNQASGLYTFTPSGGGCTNPVSFAVTVTPTVTPTFAFGTSLSICTGGAVPLLPSTSANGINGTWSPAVIDNQASGTYTFTPAGGICVSSTKLMVTVSPVVIPTFSFGTSLAICAGASQSLPTVSMNGITGTWNPSIIDNQNPGAYTFTPAAGQCATSTSVTVSINPTVTPVFSFGPSLSICSGSGVPSLPATSDNGITGTWNPSTVNNQSSGTYVFTPTGGCASSFSFSVTVTPKTVPVFSFGSSLRLCTGGVVPTLPVTSMNGITGTWSPAVVDNQNSGTYTFMPSAGQCAATANFVVTVSPIVTPTFSFGTATTICAGSSAPTLPATSQNGITGTWSPSVISNQNSGNYTFTPGAGQCATPTALIVTVNPKTQPIFNFGQTLAICPGSTVPSLPTTSNNGITGVWSPAVVSNQTSRTYTFTPSAGQCASSTSLVVTVNQSITPTFNLGTSLTICSSSNAPVLPSTSTNGITGAWSPAVISNQTSGTYTFTPGGVGCALPVTFPVTVIPTPIVTTDPDITVNEGSVVPAHMFTSTPTGASFSWTNSNRLIGLGVAGTGTVPSFVAFNSTGEPIKATITVAGAYNGCTSAAKSYAITVMPVDKEVFLANVFTPNGDGKNDFFYARSNYIKTIELRLFNQYGRLVELITDPKKGWDGTYKGTPQPNGVYMYTLKATLTDGKTIQLKGNVTLIR